MCRRSPFWLKFPFAYFLCYPSIENVSCWEFLNFVSTERLAVSLTCTNLLCNVVKFKFTHGNSWENNSDTTQRSLRSFLSLSGLPCSYLPASTYFHKRKQANKETAPIFHEHFRIISQGCLTLRIQSAAASSAAALHHSVLHLSAYVLFSSFSAPLFPGIPPPPHSLWL